MALSTSVQGDVWKKSLRSIGRPPWYDVQGELKEAFVIGVCGGSASGKTTVSTAIIQELGVPWVVILSLDSFYKVLNQEQHELAEKNEYNFDHPSSFDFDLAFSTLKKLKSGKSVKVPVYDFKSHSRLEKSVTVYGANVIVFEGILAFQDPRLLELMDLKLFVDSDSDLRLVRRLRRDISERQRDVKGVLEQYDRFVKPSFESYIAPSLRHADIVVPWGGRNMVAVDIIVQHVSRELEKRGFQSRSQLPLIHAVNCGFPKNLEIVNSTSQMSCLQTIIRNAQTERDVFLFYSKRLMRILLEHSSTFLPYKTYFCKTPSGASYEGKRFSGHGVCGVSILRAGEALEDALLDVKKDARIGKILIQTSKVTGEPELHYLRLPKDIDKDHVFLMDATVATGAAALMAIRILLDHDVPEENIIFVTIISTMSGAQAISTTFPKVKIVTAAVDQGLNDHFHIIPGIGNFGNRYFGTE